MDSFVIAFRVLILAFFIFEFFKLKQIKPGNTTCCTVYVTLILWNVLKLGIKTNMYDSCSFYCYLSFRKASD